MKNKKGPKDAESVAAMEMVTFERKQDDLIKLALKKRETAVAQIFRVAGRIEIVSLMEAQSLAMKLLFMKQVKDAKTYREEFDMTWQQFCDTVGEDRRRIDDQLIDLKPFAAAWLTKFISATGMELHKIKYLGRMILADSGKIIDNKLIYGDQEVALLPENKDEVQALIEKIESDYKTKLDETEATLRANKKIVKQKDDLLVKQEKDLRKFEKRAEGRGLSPEEDAFEQQVENFRIAFDGYMTRIEPTRMEELQLGNGAVITPRMRAMYLEALGYMRRQIVAAYDTATEIYGADMAAPGEAWTPK